MRFICVPRASGDKPPYLLYQLGSARVFPAPAGINRVRKTVYAASLSVPRASGDKPGRLSWVLRTPLCSPRQRG
ncbi:hypothetical protein G7O15_001762 [Salmonella enterica]|nr:hypothetical protein [Salmonella enterica]